MNGQQTDWKKASVKRARATPIFRELNPRTRQSSKSNWTTGKARIRISPRCQPLLVTDYENNHPQSVNRSLTYFGVVCRYGAGPRRRCDARFVSYFETRFGKQTRGQPIGTKADVE